MNIKSRNKYKKMHELTGNTIGIGMGTTVTVVYPLFYEIINKFNDKNKDTLNCGGLILDPNKDYVNYIVHAFTQSGRNTEDLIILDHDINHFKYNILNKKFGHDFNAQKLTKVIEVFSKLQCTSLLESIFKNVMILMEEKNIDININSLCNYVIDTDKCKALLDTNLHKNATIIIKNWIENISTTEKTQISIVLDQLFSRFETEKTLKNTYTTKSNVDLTDIQEKGKMIIFNAHKCDKQTASIIGTLLKLDFHHYNTFNKSLPNKRYSVFVAGEFEQFVTKKDNEIFNYSRAHKDINILTTYGSGNMKNKLKCEKSYQEII